MDFTVSGFQRVYYSYKDFTELSKEYPGVTRQSQTCAELGFTQKHISPLFNVHKRTFVDKDTDVRVTNAYWEKPTSATLIILL